MSTCYICETTEELEVFGEFHLCPDCREGLKKCSYCGEYFLDDDYVTDCNGDIYCESCRDDQLSYCEKCDEYSDSDNFVRIENLDEWWCEDCASSYAYHCENCGDWISENYGDNNTIVCNPCYAAITRPATTAAKYSRAIICITMTMELIANPATTKTILQVFMNTAMNLT